MTTKNITRRETLKLIGTVGVAALDQAFLRSNHFIQRGITGHRQPNFIIVVLDTLSARHMSLYGYQRPTTPNIERFAKTSTTFHHHYAPSNFTQPSTASILTGVYPWAHRSLDFFESLLEPYGNENLFSCLRPGYQTIAYTHNPHVLNIFEQFRDDIKHLKPVDDLLLLRTNPLEYRFNHDQVIGEYAAKRWLEDDFSHAHSLFINPLHAVAANIIAPSIINDQYGQRYPLGVSTVAGYHFKLEDTIDWMIDTIGSAESPLLGYFHLLPPHEPYKPRRGFHNMFANDRFRLPVKPGHPFSEGRTEDELRLFCQQYDEYIADVDAEFGRLIESLQAQGTLDNSYLILTSDHGQLLERGMHAHNIPAMYESVIHTPLVVHSPGQSEEINIQSPTSGVDLVPTILKLAGYGGELSLEGRLLPSLGGEEDPRRVVFSMHGRRNAKMMPLTTVTLAAVQWPFKLIRTIGYDGLEDLEELYDLENDPEEMQNLAIEKPDVVRKLRAELQKSQNLAESRALWNFEMD